MATLTCPDQAPEGKRFLQDTFHFNYASSYPPGWLAGWPGQEIDKSDLFPSQRCPDRFFDRVSFQQVKMRSSQCMHSSSPLPFSALLESGKGGKSVGFMWRLLQKKNSVSKEVLSIVRKVWIVSKYNEFWGVW